MITKEYILECLEKYCNFDKLTPESFEYQVVGPLHQAKCLPHWTWNNGATKGVLIFDDLDFVIKIPFYGYECTPHWESECGTYHSSYSYEIRTFKPEGWYWVEDEVERFQNATCENGWDYCAVEENICNKAKKKEIEECLAKTALLGYVDNYPIYIQEKCFILDDAGYKDDEGLSIASTHKRRKPEVYESLKEIRARLNFWSTNSDWLLDFYFYWGEDTLKQLAEFIKEEEIQDLHDANIGYRKGVPVLVDYSSYWE